MSKPCPRRAHRDLAAGLKDITDEGDDLAPIPAGRAPLSWLSRGRGAHALIMGRFPDVGDPGILRWLAARLPEVLVRCGVRDLDLSAATGPQRELTQAIAREPQLHADTDAIEYPSRYGETIRCSAVFETDGDLPDIAPVGEAYARRSKPTTTPGTRHATPPPVLGAVTEGVAAESRAHGSPVSSGLQATL